MSKNKSKKLIAEMEALREAQNTTEEQNKTPSHEETNFIVDCLKEQIRLNNLDIDNLSTEVNDLANTCDFLISDRLEKGRNRVLHKCFCASGLLLGIGIGMLIPWHFKGFFNDGSEYIKVFDLLNNKLNKLEQEHEDLYDLNSVLNDSLENLKHTNKTLTNEVNDLKEVNKNLTNKVIELEEGNKTLAEKVEELQDENINLYQMSDWIDERILKLENQNEIQAKKLKALRRDLKRNNRRMHRFGEALTTMADYIEKNTEAINSSKNWTDVPTDLNKKIDDLALLLEITKEVFAEEITELNQKVDRLFIPTIEGMPIEKSYSTEVISKYYYCDPNSIVIPGRESGNDNCKLITEISEYN